MGIANDWHRQIARTALSAVRDHARPGGRYALGGGNALQLHGLTTRPTQDVDLFFSTLEDFPQVARAIEEGLASAGYGVQLTGEGFSWGDEETGMREWEVTTPDNEHVVEVQAAHFELLAEPVDKEGIPVVGLEDAAGFKGHALVNRMALRDFSDVGRLLDVFTVGQLIDLVRQRDPGLADEDYAAVGDHLDALPDQNLDPFLGDGWTPARLRRQFAPWPPTAPTPR
jgi:hypothetical protein